MNVDDIKKGALDSMDAEILTVYAKVSKIYAIYRTHERVVIRFADDPALCAKQQQAFVRLNPIKGEVNGLIDGWRASENHDKQAKAALFDRRVADALAVGFQGGTGAIDCAKTILEATKRDLIEERTSWARFEYLLMAFGAASGLIVLLSALTHYRYRIVYPFSEPVITLWAAAAVGALGAFFSIAIAIRDRSVLTDLHSRDNAADAVLRVVIGAIAAALLVCMILSKLIGVSIASHPIVVGPNNPEWLLTVIVAFLAGFSERLVPDLLQKSAAELAESAGRAKGDGPPNRPAPVRDSPPATPEQGGGSEAGQATIAQEEASDDGNAGNAPGAGQGGSDEQEDGCVEPIALSDHEITHDSDLPPATGGVEGDSPA
jgi:hypothetical protein